MSGWRNNLIRIVPYTAGEQPKTDEIIKLNANESPYPPSPRVKEALEKKSYEDLSKYPSSNSDLLKEALAKRYGLSAENVFCGNGSDDVLATAFRAFFNSARPVLYPDITYSFYPVWCDLLKIPYETVPTDDDFRINAEGYFRENGGVVIANPNAPTSVCADRKLIEEIIKRNEDSVVIIDEAYIDFAEYGQSCAELTHKYENLLVTQTFSKSRSMAGMRIGMAFGSQTLIRYMTAVKDSYNSYPMTQIAIETAAASLSDEDYFKRTVQHIKRTRDDSKNILRSMGFTVMDSSTNFLFVSHPDFPAEDIFEYLKSKNVYVRFFNKPRIDNWLRITVGTDDQMKLLCKEIENFIKKG